MNVLVIRWGAMGDLVHVSPMLAALGEQHTVHVLTEPLYGPLVAQFPGVAEVFTLGRRSWPALWQLRQQLAPQRYDWVINLHPSLKTLALSWALQPKKRSTYRKQKFGVRGEALRHTPRLHAIEDFARTAGLSGGTPRLKTLTAHPEGLRIGLIPGVGGKRHNRAWLGFEQLIPALLAQYPQAHLVLFGGPAEKDEGVKLTALAPERIENRCGVGSILETAQAMATCRVVLGGDTGPLHLATAVGVPTVGLFGPTDPDRTGPWGGLVLPPPDHLACWPCEQPACPLTADAHLACQHQLSVASVLGAVAPLLAAVAGPPTTVD
jgi:ADP-heptose:LPS heptosyltransferase